MVVVVYMWCVKVCVASESGWRMSEAIYGGEFNEGWRRSSGNESANQLFLNCGL